MDEKDSRRMIRVKTLVKVRTGLRREEAPLL